VWALPSLEAAEKRVEGFATTDNFAGSLGWAVGEVALWGRVIEHESGFRAQYAYPVALTVTSRREHTARVVAHAYGIPVQWKRRYRSRPLEGNKGEAAAIAANLAEATARLAKVRSLLEKPAAPARDRWRDSQARELAELRALPPLAAPADVTNEEMLRAFIGVLARSAEWADEDDQNRQERIESELRTGVSPGEICDVLLWQRGARGAFYASSSRGKRFVRPGYGSALSAIIKELEALETAGVVEGGRIRERGGPSRRWFLTAAGRELASDACGGSTITGPHRVDEPGRTVALTPTVAAVVASSVQREIFDHERAALAPKWMDERRRAQRRGPASYERWLRRARKGDRDMLAFTDDEVLAALAELVVQSSSPVDLAAVRDRLLPAGPGQNLTRESARISSQLLRLLNHGRAKRIKQQVGPNLWLPVREPGHD
jgi:hypothetical protein